MISTIIGAIILGAIIGALGRLLVPGKQNISIIVTIIIGIVANVVVTWIVTALGYQNQSGIAWIPLILGAIVAAIIIVLYGRMTNRRAV
ncbi:MAG TPA: GlsB/YeaQ/YmgE family stress response membrane protein [Lapillicoccus sp.]|nr:GlsB/YeaQ/YmgE family stress response membrane protein [Lapillicoccus sp.]